MFICRTVRTETKEFDQFRDMGFTIVTIGGVEALLTQWSDTVITAYVPESAPVGTVEVTVTTAGGTSNALPLQVQERPAPSRVRWRFGTDALYSRPAVASAIVIATATRTNAPRT